MAGARLKQILRWSVWVLTGFIALGVIVVASLWLMLRSSLAQLEGRRALRGLQSEVLIERDAIGVPTIHATNRLDATRALGFLHAQERFFQMDISRRAGAGELSELFGPLALDRDRQQRIHRPRARAKAALEQASPEDAAMIRAYADGVNAGLEALRARPPEYLALRTSPVPWQPEDTYMVAYSMFNELHDVAGRHDYEQLILHRAFGPTALTFFGGPDTTWSAALDGSTFKPAAIPDPEEFTAPAAAKQAAAGDRRPTIAQASMDVTDSDEPGTIGSNNWAVDGRRSETGAALVANDMHLRLMVPNTWYRARVLYTHAALGLQDVVGVTLPGAPVMVAGSNKRVAWANTFSCVDITDLVQLELDKMNPRKYRTSNGWRELETYNERIKVHGANDVIVNVDETIWGPIVNLGKESFALACTMHDPQAVNLGLLSIERARNAEEALLQANLSGTPVNNVVVGDSAGHIGYSLLGRMPNRVGFSGEVPCSWADDTRGWKGWVQPADYPVVLNPTNGILWTANNRILDSPQYDRLHISLPDNGARAQQIRDALLPMEKASEQTLWSIYRDDRALFLKRWQQLMLSVMQEKSLNDVRWREARDYVAGWGGHAAVESQGYRLVRAFRNRSLNLLFEPINQHLARFDPDIKLFPEDAGWAMLEKKPAHLLNPRFHRYEELLVEAVEQVLAELSNSKKPLSQATWGNRNRLQIQHPLGLAVPKLSRWLDMPDAPVSGDSHMPKVHSPGRGVSERMIVSPGHEGNGLFNMPCGQSGHFLSPFYRTEMNAWLKIEPQPLLPGTTQYRLELLPKGSG
jgi:penicillin amidase